MWPVLGSQNVWPVIYLGHSYKSKDKLPLHKALLLLGDLFVANKDVHTATNLYKVVLTGFTHMDVHHSQADCMLQLGDLGHKQGHITEALASSGRQLDNYSSGHHKPIVLLKLTPCS
jgi:hypothetical protein